MTRVVVEGFESLYALGLRDILADDEVEFCAAGEAGVQSRLHRALPQVVVLNAASPAVAEVVGDLIDRYPTVTVITCSLEASEMQVYPPFHRGESFRCPLEPSEIGRQVHSVTRPNEGENPWLPPI